MSLGLVAPWLDAEVATRELVLIDRAHRRGVVLGVAASNRIQDPCPNPGILLVFARDVTEVSKPGAFHFDQGQKGFFVGAFENARERSGDIDCHLAKTLGLPREFVEGDAVGGMRVGGKQHHEYDRLRVLVLEVLLGQEFARRRDQGFALNRGQLDFEQIVEDVGEGVGAEFAAFQAGCRRGKVAKLVVDTRPCLEVSPYAVPGQRQDERVRLGARISKQPEQFLDGDEFPTQVRFDLEDQVGIVPDQFDERLGIVFERPGDGCDKPLEGARVEQRPGIGETLPVLAFANPILEQGDEILLVAREPGETDGGLVVVVAFRDVHVAAQQGRVGRDLGIARGLVVEVVTESGGQVRVEFGVVVAFGHPARETHDAVESGEFVEIRALGRRAGREF